MVRKKSQWVLVTSGILKFLAWMPDWVLVLLTKQKGCQTDLVERIKVWDSWPEVQLQVRHSLNK